LIDKAPSADLQTDQTDEADLGISYARADAMLNQILLGYSDAQLVEHGFTAEEVSLVRRRVDATHWKRHLPTTAMLTNTAINEFYLRPVDY
jgi:NH3-dependent NAD+ synthetase